MYIPHQANAKQILLANSYVQVFIEQHKCLTSLDEREVSIQRQEKQGLKCQFNAALHVTCHIYRLWT